MRDDRAAIEAQATPPGRHPWRSLPLRLCVVCAAVAVGLSTFITLDGLASNPALSADLARLMFRLCVALVLTIPVAILVAAIGGATGAKVAALHLAGLGLVAMGILTTPTPGHGTPGDRLVVPALWLLLLPISVEAGTVFWSAVRRWDSGGGSALKLWLWATGLVFVGWGLGLVAWSERVPSRIIAAAEAASGGGPYCLDVVDRAARTRRDLTGFSAHAPNEAGWTWSFHVLMVIGDGSERGYANWSYRTGRFEPLGRETVSALSSTPKCSPARGFAPALPSGFGF